MKITISKLLMLRKSNFAFLIIILISSGAIAQRKNKSNSSLDTNCIYNNNPILIDLDIDHDETIEANNKSFTILSIDSLRYVWLMQSAIYCLDTIINNQFVNEISDSQLVVNAKDIHYLYTSKFEKDDDKIINKDTQFVYGVLPTCWGMIPDLNIVVISCVDLNDAYATANLIDLNSGKIIPDLSSCDNGTIEYLPNKSNDYIVSYSNSIFEEEAEVSIIKIEDKCEKYCLNLFAIANLKRQRIENLAWVSKKSFCFSSIKFFDGIEQENFYEIILK
ncbi:MAG: hypothetical protein RL516_236 [Bacteroidota bacterium]|jgi:hypothetical protein